MASTKGLSSWTKRAVWIMVGGIILITVWFIYQPALQFGRWMEFVREFKSYLIVLTSIIGAGGITKNLKNTKLLNGNVD